MRELKVRDFIFPLVTARRTDAGGREFKEFLGSGFLIGKRGFGLTATHVAPPQLDDEIGALFVEDDKWAFYPLEAREAHPAHDVTILRLSTGREWQSPLRLRNCWEGSSTKYDQFGYPVDALYDIVDERVMRVVPRPDMVFVQGYVRRRISQTMPIPKVKGDQFFEVSELAGQGCSGSPLYINNNGIWDVIGIYVGERLVEGGVMLGYAVREEAFRDWVPDVLGRSVLRESEYATV